MKYDDVDRVRRQSRGQTLLPQRARRTQSRIEEEKGTDKDNAETQRTTLSYVEERDCKRGIKIKRGR